MGVLVSWVVWGGMNAGAAQGVVEEDSKSGAGEEHIEKV